MHYAPYTQDTWVTRRALLPQQLRNTDKSTNFRTIERRQSNDRKKARETLQACPTPPICTGAGGAPS